MPQLTFNYTVHGNYNRLLAGFQNETDARAWIEVQADKAWGAGEEQEYVLRTKEGRQIWHLILDGEEL